LKLADLVLDPAVVDPLLEKKKHKSNQTLVNESLSHGKFGHGVLDRMKLHI
jgi:hypothetical protein